MKKLKQQSITALAKSFAEYEDKSLKQTDYADLQSFASEFLNEPDKKKRKKLAAEFQKRHTELYQFVKENPDLIAAETETTRIIRAAIKGESVETDNKQITNLLKIMEESQHDVQ